MKNFMNKIRHKSIIVLLSLLSAIFLLAATFTVSKYVIEKRAGTLTLNLTSIDVLLPGKDFRKAMDSRVTEIVFGLTKDYEDEVAGIVPKNVDVNKAGKIKLYTKETRAYILSNRRIYANPDSGYLFHDLSELTSIYFSNFDTGMVTNMIGMFFHCIKLADVKNIASWNTESVTDMQYAFYECSSLTTLDFSSWNTASVTDMTHMFYRCSKLVSIYAGSGWNTDNVTDSTVMFQSCEKLSGGAGTSYNSAHIDKTYARIDGGAENPGYFTSRTN